MRVYIWGVLLVYVVGIVWGVVKPLLSVEITVNFVVEKELKLNDFDLEQVLDKIKNIMQDVGPELKIKLGRRLRVDRKVLKRSTGVIHEIESDESTGLGILDGLNQVRVSQMSSWESRFGDRIRDGGDRSKDGGDIIRSEGDRIGDEGDRRLSEEEQEDKKIRERRVCGVLFGIFEDRGEGEFCGVSRGSNYGSRSCGGMAICLVKPGDSWTKMAEIAAHELCHLLGSGHDGDGSECSANGSIMAPIYWPTDKKKRLSDCTIKSLKKKLGLPDYEIERS
ncbi:hypothetical protein NEHOM01_1325 [Nematocida homosporus]|uniref:uncharacterized protein n=1 Tax=Nematocida homosporus TaxID=1912981 RepID=UPI00221E378F|nr:uncharacterized protein NEHOM01_1325 [Nematocida homosporus]KAI5186160.1 hypothetical protein NEHOM01_1325 [Nematocida homosporus]